MQTAASSVHARGYTIALLSAVILAFTGILIKYIGDTYHLQPLLLAFWRNTIVCALLLPALLIYKAPILETGRKHWRYLLAYGALLAMFNTLWTTSAIENGAGVATVMLYCATAYTAILGKVLLNETLTWPKSFAVLLCLGGCAMVSKAMTASTWQVNGFGIVVGIASGMLYAGYTLMGRKAAHKGINPWITLLYTFGIAACLLGAGNNVVARLAPQWGLAAPEMFPANLWYGGWVALFILASGPTLLGFGLYNVSLCYLPSSVASIILTLEPAITTVVAYMFLGERMTPTQWIGGGIILSSVIVLRLAGYRKPQPAFEPDSAIHSLDPLKSAEQEG